MTQEQKDLLIKDLCYRLPYRVKAHVKNWSKFNRKWIEDVYTVESIHPSLNNILVCSERGSVEVIVGYYDYDIKPYLFPLSSMTEEQCEEFLEAGGWCGYIDEVRQGDFFNRDENIGFSHIYGTINWLNKNHFDYRGLIEKGLAIDATGLNIY